MLQTPRRHQLGNPSLNIKGQLNKEITLLIQYLSKWSKFYKKMQVFVHVKKSIYDYVTI
jgi:hypothetical protein